MKAKNKKFLGVENILYLAIRSWFKPGFCIRTIGQIKPKLPRYSLGKYEEDTTITPDSTKGSNEVLRSVTYRPPAMSGPHSQQSSSHPTQHRRKSTTCLGGCTERKGSSNQNRATNFSNYIWRIAQKSSEEDLSKRVLKVYSINLADEARDNHAQQIERAEIANLVRSRMESLNLPTIDYDDVSEKRNHLSYVIINPSCDLKLEEGDIIYLVRPSPFSAQKTFERHNSRRKSNISFCSNINLNAACGPTGIPVGVNAASVATGAGSRRGSGLGLNPMQMQSIQTLAGYASSRCTPPIQQIKSNSLSLPDSPTVAGVQRARSNSLRIDNDILLRRSTSLRQGLPNVGVTHGRRKSSLEEIGISHFTTLMQATNHTNPIKIALNGSIGLEVTPPEEPTPILGLPCMLSSSGQSGGINPSSAVSSLTVNAADLVNSPNVNTNNSNNNSNSNLALQIPQDQQMQSQSQSQSPQHLQGTIV
uniref:Uncharacterized protein n=1 Tax=Glossina brevipalpis TaxID=37001 RepID=A0A1A9X3G4_9MUSC